MGALTNSPKATMLYPKSWDTNPSRVPVLYTDSAKRFCALLLGAKAPSALQKNEEERGTVVPQWENTPLRSFSLFCLEERKLHAGFDCYSQLSRWDLGLPSEKVAGESLKCLWLADPKFF